MHLQDTFFDLDLVVQEMHLQESALFDPWGKGHTKLPSTLYTM